MMTLFRIFITVFWLILLVYTAIVIAHHGMGLIPIFFGDMAKFAWPGQFNLDFLGFLFLSAIWTSWRHHFRPIGLLLGLIALFGGMGFLVPYLLIVSFQVKGDVKVFLLGPERAALT